MKKDINVNELKYVVYCRKSSESEDRQVQSIETQLRELKESAERNNLNVIEIISESKSAHKAGREGFGRLLSLIKKGEANAILVIRANRISRNALDAAEIITLMDEKKLLYIRTPNSTCYTCSSTDRMMIGLELIFSKKDSDDKGDMVREGQISKYLKGYPHGQAVIGFKNDMTSEAGNRTWIADQQKFPLVKKMFTEFLTGRYSANKMAVYAQKVLKLTTTAHNSFGGKLVQESYVHTMLKNPIYAGFFFVDGIRYELNKNLPRMITENEHHRIVAMIEGKNIPKTQKHETLFTGIIKGPNNEFIGADLKFQLICDCRHKFAYRSCDKCPKCGLMIKQMQNPLYLNYTYYYNVPKKTRGESTKQIEEKKVICAVENEIAKPLSLCPELADWVKRNIKLTKDKELEENQNLKNSVQNLEETIMKEKENLRAYLRRGTITEEEYKSDIQKLQNSKPTLPTNFVDWSEKVNEIVDVGLECSKLLENREIKLSKEVILKSSSNLIWDEGKLYITRPKWLETYISGINAYKLNNDHFEPENMTESQREIPSSYVVKSTMYPSVLPDLESNQN